MNTGADGVLRFVSGAVLFPQRWSLLEKIGMDMRSGSPLLIICSVTAIVRPCVPLET